MAFNNLQKKQIHSAAANRHSPEATECLSVTYAKTYWVPLWVISTNSAQQAWEKSRISGGSKNKGFSEPVIMGYTGI